jgi:diguanylate cyclase (GGDEF)-like protein/PAS domain S-box-containing protein
MNTDLPDNSLGAEQTATSSTDLIDPFDEVPLPILIIDRDGQINDCNKRALSFIGLDRDAMIGMSLTELEHSAVTGVLATALSRIAAGKHPETARFEMWMPNKPKVLVEFDVALPVPNPNRIVMTFHDVTQIQERDRRKDASLHRMRTAFQNAPLGMAVSRAADGRIVDVNQSLAGMLGYHPDEIIGRHIEELSSPDEWADNLKDFRARRSNGEQPFKRQKSFVHKSGLSIWTRRWISVFEDTDGQDLVLTHVEDITEQRSESQRMVWATTHDSLTELPNRTLMISQLECRLETIPDVAMLFFIDLDHFKLVNDSLGHDVGDVLLQTMGDRLRECTTETDLLCRFGGDEFIIVSQTLPDVEAAQSFAEFLRAEIAKPLVLKGSELFVTASVGIAFTRDNELSTADLLQSADAAMNRAKARGRDCVELFTPALQGAAKHQLRTTTELHKAIERQEIVPYFQPIVDLSTGKLAGLEVLARWQHPDRGLLPPDQFLPIAEESGLIRELGAVILNSSLSYVAGWRERHEAARHLAISVNVSVRQVMDIGLEQMVVRALETTGVPADNLWLEITETVLLSDTRAATRTLNLIRALGVHLSVDDFGTGYSSLSYLRKFPVEEIKIDRSFVGGLCTDVDDAAIVEAVLRLGQTLGLRIVAEGIETQDQAARLRELECTHGQGFLFGRPVTPEEIEATYFGVLSQG